MKKQTKNIIIGSVILLFLGAGSGITYYVVNQGSDNNSARQETSSEYATFTDVAQADADIENETTDNVSMENIAADNTKDENTTETAEKPNGFGETTEETTDVPKPSVGTQKPKPSTTQAQTTQTPKPTTTQAQVAQTPKPTTTQAQNNTGKPSQSMPGLIILLPISDEPVDVNPTENTPTTEEYVTTEEASTECSHDWAPVYKLVHHDAVTHTEEQEVCVKDAWTEEIYTWQEWCCHCKLNFTKAGYTNDEMTLHLVNCADGKGSSWMVEYLLWDTIEHPAEYEMQNVTVVDKEAWDEEVVDYYRCNKCGLTKWPDTQ